METEIFNKLSPMNQRHSGTREPVTCPESGARYTQVGMVCLKFSA